MYPFNKPEDISKNVFLVSETCEKMYCSFGALCLVDQTSQQAYCRCEQHCPDVFSPVCGSDSVTYSSDCQLQMASCSQQRRIYIHHQGQCGTCSFFIYFCKLLLWFVLRTWCRFCIL
ncbi:kazal-like domain-containing protein [Caerostris darwini]|uniref:Kazal-like domain-containing protein n=1 Tax=Caerostris darwini TaxID=1538125 RepID=A0AAV4WRT3_9ARAC|nr:kazal-like domain-containing protein [Caerostris darwini]